jgi:tRNA G37 N-methylase Trm5
VVDIGAGIGFFERYSYLKNASKIICFEPDKEKFELLKLNANKNTILFNADVTDHVGEYIIFNNIINTYCIDYLFDAELINKINLLKIDNYGKEEMILKGINDFNLEKIKNISIKWNNFNLDENNKIIEHYSNNGFKYSIDTKENCTVLYFYKK